MEYKRYLDTNTAGMASNERLLLIPNFTIACEDIKNLIDSGDPHMIHAFIIFDQQVILDLDQSIDDIDVDKKLYVGTIIDAMPHVKNGCVIIKTTKQIHDFVDKLDFDGFLVAAIDFCHCAGKYNFVVKIYLNNSESYKCIKDGRSKFKFTCNKGKPFWMW